MSKFNLKNYRLANYEKIDGDKNVETRLREDSDVEPDNFITEKQLEGGRVDKKNTLVEDLLKDSRTGEGEVVIEKALNDSKSKLVKHRDEKTSKGNMNKLEEKRLANNPVEKQKYELFMEVPKKFKWWETKDKDGHIIAKNTKATKLARLSDEYDENEDDVNDFDVADIQEDELKENDTFVKVPEDIGVKDWKDINKVLNVGEEESKRYEKSEDRTMRILDPKESSDPTKYGKQEHAHPGGPIHTIYLELIYNPDDFQSEAGDRVREIKQTALDTVLIEMPELASYIDINDFQLVPSKSGVGFKVALKGILPKYIPALDEEQSGKRVSLKNEGLVERKKSTIPGGSHILDELTEEISFNISSFGGTPTAYGKVKIDHPITEENRDDVVENTWLWISTNHPELDLSEENLDLSNIDKGEISYICGLYDEEEEVEEPAKPTYEDEDFPITEEALPVTKASAVKSVVISKLKKN